MDTDLQDLNQGRGQIQFFKINIKEEDGSCSACSYGLNGYDKMPDVFYHHKTLPIFLRFFDCSK